MCLSTKLTRNTYIYNQLLFLIISIHGQCNIPNCESCASGDLTCTRCVSGYYPYFATCTACSKGCVNVTSGPMCDATSGICTRGCTPGWVGERCNRCDSNYYKAGDTCYKCSDHCVSSCDGTTGSCFGGCREGYWNSQCTMTCSPFCEENKCDHTNGTCIYGCINGFYGLLIYRTQGTCVGACTMGYYGKQCDKRCNAGCFDNRCDRLSGHCTSDCQPGFFGNVCSINCSGGCQGACNRETGICITGCKPGYYGDICNNSCNVNCKTGYCDRSSGNCVGDCRDGYFGDQCSKLCVCSRDGNSDQTTGFSPDTYIEPHACSDNSPIVIGVVVAVVIVLLGSIANYIIWKRNIVQTMQKRINNGKTVATVETTRYYSEIEEVDKPNNYEDLKIYTDIL